MTLRLRARVCAAVLWTLFQKLGGLKRRSCAQCYLRAKRALDTAKNEKIVRAVCVAWRVVKSCGLENPGHLRATCFPLTQFLNAVQINPLLTATQKYDPGLIVP